jgi:hypothetical protein
VAHSAAASEIRQRLLLSQIQKSAALLWMSIILSAVIGTMRREPPFDIVLNHRDETVAHAALYSPGQQHQSIRPG